MRVLVWVADGIDPGELAAEWHSTGQGYVNILYPRLDGFCLTVDASVWHTLQNDQRVRRWEPDFEIRGEQSPTIQSLPSAFEWWGLDRLDQRTSTRDNEYHYHHDGTGVPIYMMDTGIRATHEDFTGRVAQGYGGTDSIEACSHGTGTAGIAAGVVNGVAKGADIIACRTLNCDGSGSGSHYFDAIDWILTNHPSGTPGVVNMSLTGAASTSADEAAESLADAGLVVVVAAGSQSALASTRSPARSPVVITVGASAFPSEADSMYPESNFGPAVDLFAPGSGVRVLSHTSDSGSTVNWGTSFSCAFVSGICALILEQNPYLTHQEVKDILLADATSVTIDPTSGNNSPELLAYSLVDVPVPEWVETTDFQVEGNLYDDDTAVEGEWYRYRVAGAEDEQPVTEWTDWVIARLEVEDPANLQATVDAGVVTLTWDASPMVPEDLGAGELVTV